LSRAQKDWPENPSQKIHIEGLSHGHGGMDFIEDYRLINALRKGVSPDIDVYVSVSWIAIIPLSMKSVAKNGEPVKFQGFTRGQWRHKRELGIFKYKL